MESSTRIVEPRRTGPRRARRPLSAHARRARAQTERSARARVLAAFRRLAHGVATATAYARSVEFYRSSGHAWTRHLG